MRARASNLPFKASIKQVFFMKILLSAYTGLGNFVLKTPLIAHIHAQYPNAIVDVITGNAFGIEQLAAQHRHINQVHYLDAKDSWQNKIRFFRQIIQPQHYDALFLPFDAQPNWLQIVTCFANIGLTVKHHLPNKKQTFVQKIANKVSEILVKTLKVEVLPNRHETQLNLDLLATWQQKAVVNAPQTQINYQVNPKIIANFGLQNQPYIVIQPGAANGAFSVKAWNPNNFVLLINQLHAKYPAHKIVIVGDKGDYETVVKHIYQQLPKHEAVVNTAGKTNINDLLNLLALAQLVICHDSGVMHLADALSVPLIALYGPTDYVRTRPLRLTSVVLQSDTPYKNAMHYFALTEADLAQQGIAHQAMDGISVEQVMAAANKWVKVGG